MSGVRNQPEINPQPKRLDFLILIFIYIQIQSELTRARNVLTQVDFKH